MVVDMVMVEADMVMDLVPVIIMVVDIHLGMGFVLYFNITKCFLFFYFNILKFFD